MIGSKVGREFGFVFLFLFVVSCGEENSHTKTSKVEKVNSEIGEEPSELKSFQERKVQKKGAISQDSISPIATGLVDVQMINSAIWVDLKYATTDNFMKMKLYDTLTKAYLQADVALRLSKCQDYLTKTYGNYHLLVYDAVRPISVQYKMWKALDSIPVSERSKFVSNPANGSIHNYGAAVDLTICNEKGIPLDMGAGYDDIRKIAYPSLEAKFLKSGELTPKQLENRKMLRNVMYSQNFRNISTEWWHFNACTRANAKIKYKPLNE